MSAPPTRELLGLSFLVACLFSGSIYGWAPFSSILIGEGFFSLDCGAGLRPCDAQQQEITLAFTIATSAMMIAAFPSGILCDQVGPVVTSMIAGTLCAGGAVALALLEPAHSAADAWRGYLVHASFSCLACGGNLAFFVCFKVVALYHYDKGKQALVGSAMPALFGVSAIVPLVMYAAYSLGAARATIFGMYGALAAALFGAWAALWRVHAPSLDAALRAEDHPPTVAHSAWARLTVAIRTPGLIRDSLIHADTADRDAALLGGTGHYVPMHQYRWLLAERHAKDMSHESAPDVPALTTASFPGQVRSVQFALVTLWFSVHQLRANTFMASAAVQLEKMGDTRGVYMSLYTALLPTGPLFSPLFAWLYSRLGLLGLMQAVTAAAALFCGGLLLPYLPLQLLTFVVFVGYNTGIYTVYNLYVLQVFGPRSMGSILGAIALASSVTNFLVYPISGVVASRLEGRWTLVNAAFALLTLLELAQVDGCRRLWARRRPL